MKLEKISIQKLLTGVAFFFILCVVQYYIYGYHCQLISNNDKKNYNIQYLDIIENAEGWQIEEKESEIAFTSISNDPKIFFHLDEEDKKTKYLFFDIDVVNMFKNNNEIFSTKGEIYYAAEMNYTGSQKVEYTLKKGHNIIAVPMGDTYTDFRIDLASEKGISISIRKMQVTNYLPTARNIKIILTAFMIDVFILFISYMPEQKSRIEKKLDKLFVPIKSLYINFRTYLKENIAVATSVILFVILSYGLLCTYYTIYIDEERQIIEAYATQGWIEQGRFGNYIFERYLLAGRVYTSYLGDAIAAILLGISTLIQCYNFYRISSARIGKLSQIIYSGIAISVPYIYGAYMVVGIYNIEISLAICLTSLATTFIFLEEKTGKIRYLYAIILLIVSISIYQAFVPLFITNVVLCCLVFVEFNNIVVDVKQVFYKIFGSAVVCIIALVIYYILNKIFILDLGNESDYLANSFIGWGKGTSPLKIIYEIFAKIREVIIGSSSLLFGGVIYRITFGGLGLYALIRFIKIKENRFLFLFLLFCSIMAPFCMNFVLGNTLFAGRTLLGIPSLLGVSWLLIIERFSNKNYIRWLIYSIAFYLIFIQIQYINQYFLADFKRYQQDQIITQEIITDIREACGGYMQMPIVPVGVYYHEDNGLTMYYELAGSYYTVDGGSISRIIHFMQAQGYNVEMPTSEQIADSYNYVGDMPSWPEKGSVKNVNGYVIVKLSEPSQNWINSYVLPYQ